MSETADLAARFLDAWFTRDPFAATSYGVPGYDHLVPDASPEGDDAWRSRVEAVLAQAAALEAGPHDHADAITLGCVRAHAEQQRRELESASARYTVTAMPFDGPAQLCALAARTVLADAAAAEAFLARLRASGGWIDARAERLREGAAAGLFPVARLLEQAVSWCEQTLEPPVPAAVRAVAPPDQLADPEAFCAARDTAGAEVLRPALARYREILLELRANARPDARAGLAHLAGGDAAYARAVASHTTLSRTPAELHATGLAELARLEEEMVELGAAIGLRSLPAVHEALRASSRERSASAAIDEALAAIRRAEARAPEVFPEPLPAPCAVTAMPPLVGASGMAPHYTPPRLDGTRAGTFWFNLERPTAGTGWDLEGVAFHEAVPGHHLQLSRVQLLTHLPAIQRQRSVTAFSEGWGLYAEQLAEEMGLYSDERALLGARAAAAMRACRLVVDTGLHALGWSRGQALDFFLAHTPMPPEFLAAEIDRYLCIPGQALAYLTGKLELLRLRDRARQALGGDFSLAAFHAAVLDHGSLPLPVLARSVEHWIATRTLT
ncbi:MAG: DUF885 domain-containing protein [Actinomycetota bacterium]|nr:DUF885 domain-containing protein [Actinomycetota bacterium]